MAYEIATLKSDVRKLLDEQPANSSGFINSGSTTSDSDADDTEIDALIATYAPEARNFVLGACDAGLLEKDCIRASLTLSGGTGTLTAAVLRAVRATNANWKRDVVDFIDKGSKDYTMLAEPESAGTIYSPKVAIGYGYSSSNMQLSFTVSPSSGTTYFYYVAQTALTSTGDLAIEGAVLQAAARHYIAGLVCQSLGDNRADGFFQMAMNYMGVSADKG